MTPDALLPETIDHWKSALAALRDVAAAMPRSERVTAERKYLPGEFS